MCFKWCLILPDSHIPLAEIIIAPLFILLIFTDSSGDLVKVNPSNSKGLSPDSKSDEASSLLESGDNPFEFDGLTFTKSPEESVKINKIKSGAIIISASGMCESGRIKHHLKHNLWRKESSIVFVGYQAEGTLGRAILNGAKKVKIFGEEIAVNAQIYNLQGLSGHADRQGLITWLDSFKNKPKGVLLVHGEKESQNSFKELLDSKGYTSLIMKSGETFIPGSEIKENSEVRDKIVALLDSLEDIDNMDKDLLLAKIKESI